MKLQYGLKKSALNGIKISYKAIGDIYLKGNGVKQDFKEAFKWYEKISSQGIDIALNTLGLMYLSGKGVKKDYKKALELFENSAANEYEKAYSNIGYIYSYGLGVKQDKEKSQEFYKKANAISNKNHIKLIEEQSKHLFLGNNSKLIDSSNKSNFLTISNNIKDRLDINLYFMTSLDNNISNDLTNIQQQEALKKYYEYIKLHIDASKNYIVFIISPNQKYIDIINYPNILSNDEKNEIINNLIIPEFKNISSNNIEEKINLVYKTGVERLVEILNKKYNINLNSDYYESLNTSLQKK